MKQTGTEELKEINGLRTITELDAAILSRRKHFRERDAEEPNPFCDLTEEQALDVFYEAMRDSKRNIPTKQFLKLMINTQYPSIKDKILEGLIERLGRAEEIEVKQFRPGTSHEQTGSKSGNYQQILQSIPLLIPHLSDLQQKHLLWALIGNLVALTPSPQSLNEGRSPSFNLYTTACKSAVDVVKMFGKPFISAHRILNFTKHVLKVTITIASSVSEVVKLMHMQFSAYALYIGELLPFVAAVEPFLDSMDSNLIELLMQFWICSVLFSLSHISGFFCQWEDALDRICEFMPPLIQQPSKNEFAAMKYRVQELVRLIKPQTDDLISVFVDLIPGLNPKLIQPLEVADAIYALSIYSLEMLRAERGIFGPIFVYFEAEYTTAFSQLLDAMIEPIYATFKKANASIPHTQRTLVLMIESVYQPNQHIHGFIDRHLIDFIQTYPKSIFSFEALLSIQNAMKDLGTLPQPRQDLIKQTIDTLFYSSLKTSSHLFEALIQSFIIYTQNMPFVFIASGYFPRAERDLFMQSLQRRIESLGKAHCIEREQLLMIEDVEERVYVASEFIIQNKDPKDLTLLITKAKSTILLSAWSAVFISVPELGNALLFLFLQKISENTRLKQGIFAEKEPDDWIPFQATVFRMLKDLENLSMLGTKIFEIVSLISKSQILYHPRVISAIIPLAILTGRTILSFSVPIRTFVHFQNFLQRLALMSYSFTNNPEILKEITQVELAHLEQLIQTYQTAASVQDFGFSSSSNSVTTRERSVITRVQKVSIEKTHQNFLRSVSFDKKRNEKIIPVITYLLCCELRYFTSYLNQNQMLAHVQKLLALHQLDAQSMHLSTIVPSFWAIEPQVIPAFEKLLSGSVPLRGILWNLMQKDLFTACEVPELALYFSQFNSFDKTALSMWTPLEPLQALSLLKPDSMRSPQAAAFVVRSFDKFTDDELLMFIPQLVQSLRFDSCHVLEEFLKEKARVNDVCLHYLLWNILSEKENHVTDTDNLPEILTRLESELHDLMTPEQHRHKNSEFGLIDTLDRVSRELFSLGLDERVAVLADNLNGIEVDDTMYIPSNPNLIIKSIVPQKSLPLKSHSRVPIKVQFMVHDRNDPDPESVRPFSCIFKIEDDVRQDALMIQFIYTFESIFKRAGIECYMLPYRVFATGQMRGVIQVIEHSKSRHDLGVATGETLLNYFLSKYGQPTTPTFIKAQENFVKSMAPYAVLCYIFQVKDRHNANIMYDDDGHLIHIDFGFIFDISPGGNFKFEKAPFKLTQEMIDVMGGSKEAPAFKEFFRLFVQCFFAVRSCHSTIESIADLMRGAGLPCFRTNSIKNLRDRFFLDLNPKDVVKRLDALVDDAMGAVSTGIYDAFQHMQNRIIY